MLPLAACIKVAFMHGPLLPPLQTWVAEHVVHAAPPLPQVAFVMPVRHWPAEQQPPQEVLSQTQLPLTQRVQLPHVPAMHVPPQPLLAPHALPAQSGTQTHALVVQVQPL
jgi:hypothetical protein